MSSMKDIRRRISNINSTGQIIKAMDMIASTKLHKARAQLKGVRPIYNELKRIVKDVGSHSRAAAHPFYSEREVRNSLYLVLTSDRGFSGGYNSNIIAKTLEHMGQGKNEKIIVVGSKGYSYFKHKNKNIIWKLTDIPDSQVYYESENVANMIISLFLSGEADEVLISYTRFENVMSYIPIVERLLPLPAAADDRKAADRKYEPDLFTYIDHVIPLYMHMSIFRAFSESHTSEQAARMVSMDAAEKNAFDMIEKLTSMYNRRRQAAITQEISEIVGSANIMYKGGVDDKY